MKQIIAIVKFLFIALAVLLPASGRWIDKNFGDVTYEQILFHIKMPVMQGINTLVVLDFIKDCIIPIFLFYFLYLILKKYFNKWFGYSFIACILILGGFVAQGYWHFDELYQESKNAGYYGNFYEANYQKPKRENIIFPEQKRNLVVVFLESMEMTYANFEGENLIPHLKNLADKHYSFNGLLNNRGGGISFEQIFGTGWTMAGIVGYSCGIPLNIPIDGNQLGKRSLQFLGGAICLGDILEYEGYKQIFIMPHKKKFSGLGAFVKTHGNMEARDLEYYKRHKDLSNHYQGFWGLKDALTFEYAKEALNELSQKDTPFALYVLSIDTHAQDGYSDPEKCHKKFDIGYKNAIACTDKIAGEFISWIVQQEFYKNTTVVIVGDHLSMAQNFFAPKMQREIFNVFIHPNFFHSAKKQSNRQVSHFDFYPTILDSLGVEIKNNQLGLGVDLMSEKPTLLEQSRINEEIKKKSKIYEHFLFDMEKYQ